MGEGRRAGAREPHSQELDLDILLVDLWVAAVPVLDLEARRVFVAMGRFAVAGSPTTTPSLDATLTEEDDRRRVALLAAVSRETAAWMLL